ncbi:MAG: bifunctional 2-keto-4-hydroxyglutarate aldolase/2-keto-3-deoxy-6-phosphogluconate aldolase [Verrucomicrobiae bacterium]|nr:bifunctional 2-keto-4-hydroxyglutarate aldolase/2-keto-3-deoxy-6-phosphogluconate aldolase [Verrucomicrobiae bacterium]
MKKNDIFRRLSDPGIVAVIRADSSEQLMNAAQALCDGGVDSMEVTMTTPNALQVIEAVTRKFGDKIVMGVGTVLDDVTARLAILAGAEFVVTPVLRLDVVTMCRRYDKPVVCGAYTPTEALTAHEAGADFIKIFPADGLGPNYIKAIKAPLPQLRIIPTGGVEVKNCADFVKAGCSAVGVGGNLVSKEILKNQDWKKLTETARAFVAAMKAAKA